MNTSPFLQSYADFEVSDKVIGGVAWQIESKNDIRGGIFTSIVIGEIESIKIQIGVRFIKGNEKADFYSLFTLKGQIISFYNANFESPTVQAACLEAVRLLKRKVAKLNEILETINV